MKKLFGLTVLGAAIASSNPGIFGIFSSMRVLALPASYQISISENTGSPILGQTSPLIPKESVDEEETNEAPKGPLPILPLPKPILGPPVPAEGWGEETEDIPMGKEILEMEIDPGFAPVIEYAVQKQLHQRSMGEIMQAIADYFVGSPYEAGLLDESDGENLVITLNGFDCVLFVETVLAIARGVAVENYSYQTFANNISQQRYWQGEMDGYCSRMHYFSEWIADNHKRGNVKNIAVDLGGLRVNKQLYYMSQHRWNYPQIANNDANYQCIVNMEDNISRLNIDYIPYSDIRSVYSQLQPGDIIAVATEVDGLDVTHTGLVYRLPDGNIGFIHASPAGRVTVAYDLHRYIWNVESAIGILVARPVDPRGSL